MTRNELKIAVTGHQVITGSEKLSHGIDHALAEIERANPGKDWVILSQLAEGADRLVVWRALRYRMSARLVVQLPFSPDEYQANFASYESRLEFQDMLDLADEVLPPPISPNRGEAYSAVSESAIQQADVLVALWDGDEIPGHDGTARMVALARQRRIPLAWVHCVNREPGNHAGVSITDEEGSVEFV